MSLFDEGINREQARKTIQDLKEEHTACEDDSLMPINLEKDLPPGTPDFVTKDRKGIPVDGQPSLTVPTMIEMKWNGMDPDLQLVAEFNRRVANIRSAQRELRDASQRWAQMQDPAVAVEIVAAQRQLKAAERRKEMMQDMGVAAVPTLLARAEGADPFNPNILAAPASSAASATTTRSRLVADSSFAAGLAGVGEPAVHGHQHEDSAYRDTRRSRWRSTGLVTLSSCGFCQRTTSVGR